MLVACVGNIGSGKTVLLTALLHLYHDMGRKVYSNMESLKFPFRHVTSYEGLRNISNGVLGMSEFWIWADSRQSSKKENRTIGEVILQSRKDSYDVIYDLQDFGQIDKRIRAITDQIFYCRDTTQINPIEKIFHIDLYRRFITGNYEFVRTMSINLSPFFHLYNTNEKYTVPKEEGKNVYKRRKIPQDFKDSIKQNSTGGSLELSDRNNGNNDYLLDFNLNGIFTDLEI